jgi:serine acetyltransferase
MPTTNGDIHVGSYVWNGTGASILSGVQIGEGAIIASYAVVTRDIPPYAIAAGEPAKPIRYRFDHDTITQLLEIKWWNWSDEKIREYINLLSSPDIKDFITILKKVAE